MRRLAECLNSGFFIASAGLGLVRGDSRVPGYDLSTSISAPSAVQRRVIGPFSPKDWWTTLQQSPYASSISELFAGEVDGLVLVALSNSYVPLLSEELHGLAEMQRDRLRLFGAVDSKYPVELRRYLMPYDARLDVLVRGSKVDFAQRAAEHFVKGLLDHEAFPVDLDGQRSWVASSLDRVVLEPVKKRQVLDDAQIRAVAGRLAGQGLTHTKALHVLRQEHGIACEQSRFRRLFREVAK